VLGFTRVDRFHRRLTGFGLIAGSLLIFIGVLVQPSLGPDSATALAAADGSPGQLLAATLIFMLSVILLIPGLLGLMRLLTERGAVLGQIGGGLSVVGCICLAAYHTGHAFMIEMARDSTLRPEMVALLDSVNQGAYATVVVILLLLGFGIGPLVLLAGIYRAGFAPTWVIVLAAASNVMTWTTSNEIIIAVSNGLFAIGFGLIGLIVLRAQDALLPHSSPAAEHEINATSEPQTA
jgi:hypothetical protein